MLKGILCPSKKKKKISGTWLHLLKSLFTAPMWQKAGPANTWDAGIWRLLMALPKPPVLAFPYFRGRGWRFSCLQVPVPKAAAVPLSPRYLFPTSSIISFPCTRAHHKYFDRTEIGSNYTFSFAGTSEGMATSWPDTAAQL